MYYSVIKIAFLYLLMGYFLGYSSLLQAQPHKQEPVIIYRSMIGDSLYIYGDNQTVIPYQVKVKLSITNGLQEGIDAFEKTTYQVIKPGTSQNVIMGAFRGQQSRYQYQYFYLPGNPDAIHEDTTVYMLPYREGERYRVIQGYMGRHSHENEYMLDFDMPENTPVHAARGGIVFDVKKDSDRGGPDRAFMDDANYIHIMHEDGSFAQYYHLRQYGTTVNIGDTVSAGQLIGYSGNTGFSTRPHLHFTVRVPVNMDTKTVPTLFKLNPNKTGHLRQGRRYRSSH